MPASALPTMPLATALSRLAREPDADAWAAVVECTGESLQRLACRLTGDAALADDVVQEVLLIVRDRADSFRPQGDDPDADARRWVMRIGINVSLKLLRSERRLELRERAYAEQAPADATETVEASTVRLEHAALLRQALAQLPETVRTAIVLHHISGAGFKEVARQFDCPVGTVKARISRGLLTLRELLLKQGVVLSAGGIALDLHRLPAPLSDPAPLLATCQHLLHAPYSASIQGLPAAAARNLGVVGKFMLAVAASAVAALGILATYLALRHQPPALTPSAVITSIPHVAPAPAPISPLAGPDLVQHLAAPPSLLVPPACAVVMIPHVQRVLEHLDAANLQTMPFGADTPLRARITQALHDPALSNLQDAPILVVISADAAGPGTACIIPCIHPGPYVEAAIAQGLAGEAFDGLALVGSTTASLAAAMPTARQYHALVRDEIGSDVRIQLSPRQLAANFAVPLRSALSASARSNPGSEPLVTYILDVMQRLSADLDLVTLDFTGKDRALLMDLQVHSYQGGALERTLQALVVPAGPRAGAHLQATPALLALQGRLPCSAIESYLIDLVFPDGQTSPFSSIIKPGIIPLMKACSQGLTGDIALRLTPTPDSWMTLEQASGCHDAAVTQAANDRLLDAQNVGTMDVLGINFQRRRQERRIGELAVEEWSYALSDPALSREPRVANLSRLLAPCVVCGHAGFIYCANDDAAILRLTQGGGDGPSDGMHTHAESVLPAEADGYWDADPAGFQNCYQKWLRPLILGGASGGFAAPQGDAGSLWCGSWIIADGNALMRVRIPEVGDVLRRLEATIMQDEPTSPAPSKVSPQTPSPPVRPLF